MISPYLSLYDKTYLILYIYDKNEGKREKFFIRNM